MKDIYTVFNETIDELRKSPAKEKKFRSLVPLGAKVPVEVQLNCAKEVLAGKVVETQRTITKHNGAADNTLLSEASSEGHISEKANPSVASDRLLWNALGISESDQRKLQGLPSEDLNEAQMKEYWFCRSINLSEADALRLAKK